MKEILLYYTIYSSTAADLIRDMEAAKSGDLDMRVNSGGGETYTTYGIIAKFLENKNKKRIKVDGFAGSMAAFLCCYADDVECLDVSSFVFHRAAFWYEENPLYFTEDVRAELIEVNRNLRAAMEAKMPADKFEEETGISYDDLFSLDTRIDVKLNARQAERLGLVSKVNKITPKKRKEVEAMSMQFAAKYSQPSMHLPVIAESVTDPKSSTLQIFKSNKMTKEQFKAEHPELYAAAVNEGVTAERDRVGSFLAFIGVDTEAVTKGIKGGEPLTQTAMAEFTLKAINKQAGATAEAENAPDITTDAPDGPVAAMTPEAKRLAEFNAAVDSRLKK